MIITTPLADLLNVIVLNKDNRQTLYLVAGNFIRISVACILSILHKRKSRIRIFPYVLPLTFHCLLFLGVAAQSPPVITSFAPTSGPIGTTVIITGATFSPIAANNIVFFGAVRAIVSAATTTSLRVTVPAGATYQPITVTTNSLSGYSAQPFIMTFPVNAAGFEPNFFAPKVNYVTGNGPNSVSISDIDGDGKVDIAVTNVGESVSVLRNTSTGGLVSFAAKVDYATVASSVPHSVCIGDLNGDGKPDLVLANENSKSVSIFINTSTSGTISFAAKLNYPTADYPYNVSIGDLDGDGKPDLAVANNGEIAVSVLRNTSTNGIISFAGKVDYATGSNCHSVSIVDVDGDGKPDLAAANSSSNTISLFRNISTSGIVSFAAKVDIATGLSPNRLSIGDLDGDGKPDLAVINYSADVSVFRNTSAIGNISFAKKVDYTTGSNPFNISIGDLDGDGKPDLAMTNYGSGTFSIFRNMSTSGIISLEAKVDYPTGTYPYGISIGDLDGDGKPDIAVTNYASATVSVYRNKTSTIAITIGNLLNTNLCAGNLLNIPFTTSGPFNANNVFTIQMSDSLGSFTNAVDFGTLSATSSDTIHTVIPANTSPGANYRVRVISSSPAVASATNTNPININQSPASTFSISGSLINCAGLQTYTTMGLLSNNILYNWTLSGGGALDTTTAGKAKVNWTAAGLYTLAMTPSNSCGIGPQKSLQIKVFAAVPSLIPQINVSGRTLTAANAIADQVLGYQWYKDDALITGATGSSYNAVQDGTYTLTFTNTCGMGPVSMPVIVTTKTDQTVTIAAIPDKRLGDPPFTVIASASSGLPVALSITTNPAGIATLSADTIIITGTGTVTVSAVQKGNNDYNPSLSVQRTFTVLPAITAPDLAVQSVVSGVTSVAPADAITLSWNIANVGTAPLPVNWTERIHMQSATGENRTLLKQSVFSNAGTVNPGQIISRNDSVSIPLRLNIGDQGVFVVELIPGSSIQEKPGSTANNIGTQQAPWTVRKLLTLNLSAAQVTEDSPEKIIATVSRTGSLTAPLTISISLHHAERFSFPSSITIAVGQAGATFTISAMDNAAAEGTITDTLHVAATGFQAADGKVSILDDDKASLTIISLPVKAMEGDTVRFKVTTNLAPSIPLQVFLTSSSQARFPIPSSVIIPAGALSADVTIILKQNNIPEIDLAVSIAAGASNLNPVKATILINDDDVPGLELILQTSIISESAGLYATQATLRRTAGSNSIAFTANLSASLANTLILPASVSLEAGVNEKLFTIGAVDNSLVDGQRQVVITASIFVASCGCSASPASAGSVSASLTVSDNDGPALQLTSAKLTFPEGAANVGQLRVSRNTPTNEALLVNLSSSDTNKALIAATVLIPSGQAFIDVSITTINDGVTGGNKQVYFNASATGFSPGSIWIIVTDQNKPDLQIPSVKLTSANIQAMSVFNYQFSVKNTGFSTAPAGVVVRGYLSVDNIIDTSDILISEDIISEPIAAGQTVQILNAVKAPNFPRPYKLLFWVNPDESLAELLFTNNTSAPVSLSIKPEYTATANVNLPYFIKGTAVPVTGSAQYSDGKPAAGEQVEVYVISGILRRNVMATTDTAGHYTAQFIPLAGEAGHYAVGACFPGMGDTTAQDVFDILGVRINSGNIPQFKVTLNDTLKGSLVVQNLSDQSLRNFSLTPVSVPGGASIHFDTIPVLGGNASVTIAYRVTGSALSAGNNFEVASLQAIAAEGPVQKTDVFYFCQASKAYLTADITKMDVLASQSKGERLVEFRLVNKGQGSSGNITVSLPQVNWISSVTPKVLPSLAMGDTAVVTLKFLATADVPFDYAINGSIGISTQNGNSFSIPFSFKKVAETTGAVKVIVTNQFTYFTEGAPKVKGAHVVVMNYFSGVVYADGYTDSAGAFAVSGIPEGKHRIVVDKDKHLPYNSTITVDPGNTVESTVFLNYQAVTFSWSVVPTAVQDQYDITLTTQFETNIPIPVVTIEMPKTMPKLSIAEVYAFNVTLTNHGLITARDVALNLPDDPEYEFVMNYVPSDLLAQQSLQVPVLMRRRTSPPTSNNYATNSIAGISQFLGMNASQYSDADSEDPTCRYFCTIVYWYNCDQATGLWQRSAFGIKFDGRICTGNKLTGVILAVPGNYPTFPCAVCPTYNLSPASGSTSYTAEKKSCVECWKEIAKVIKSCIVKANVLSCTINVVKLLITCAATESDGSVSSFSGINPLVSSANSTLPAAYNEIVQNLEIAITAYKAQESLNSEYYGYMIINDAWKDLKPMLEPYITTLDSIRPAAQASILNAMAGYEIQPATLQAFFIRWNTSIYAHSQNVLEPTTQYPDIVNWTNVKAWSDSLAHANKQAISKGFESVDDMYKQSYASLQEIIDKQSNAVCASVTVQFSQQLTMTREAFEGTLQIFNGHPTDAMDSLSVNIQITDENGVPSNGLFEIQTKSLTGLADIIGTGAITAQQTGIVKFLFTPELMAAPQVPKLYNFSGSVRYWDPYAKAIVTLPLSPVPLTVNPSPNLMLHYFMQRNILGDDALTTPDIEPSVPAELAVMAENQGYGPAVNMTISSSQPKVVDNEKGLAINFNLIGSNFQGQPKTLGVTNINFGTIPALQSRIGQWYFTSSLLGKFVSYEASVVHANSFGNPGLSLVKGVKIHELTKSIRVYGQPEDGINDFLVNDIFDTHDVPDILYFSQGNRTEKVFTASAGSFSSMVASPSFTNMLTVTASDTGWNYIKLDDPGHRLYDIVSVTRSDRQIIPLDNAWLTFVTLPVSQAPVYENKFHFVDRFASSTPVTYTVIWKPRNLNVPRVDSINGVPKEMTSAQVNKLKVVFNKSIDPASFIYEDLTLTFQGGPNIMNNSIVITQIDSATFNVDISKLTTGNGFYAFTVQAANVMDIYGMSGLNGKQATWTQFLDVPAVQAFQGIPDNRVASSFDKIQVLFNLSIDVSTITPERFTVVRDSMLQSGRLTIDSVRSDHKLFYLSGLKNMLTRDGAYELIVDLPKIQSVNHVSGIQAQSVVLTVDNTGPLVLSLEKSNIGGLDSQHVTFVNITFNENVGGFNTSSLQLTRNKEVLPLNIAQLSNKDLKLWMAGNFGMLTYPDGDYTFTVKADSVKDAIGNYGSGLKQVSWTVNRSALVSIKNLVITPDLGFSNTDGVTSGIALNVAFNLSANASQVTVSQVDLSGETVLSVVANVAAGEVSLPFTLSSGGNTGIRVTATGANGGVAMAQKALYIDQIALTAKWSLAANQSMARQVDTILVTFSSRLLSDTGLLSAIRLSRNGVPISTTGLKVAALNDTSYSVYGFQQVGSVAGNYQLTLNLQSLHKYSSGMAGIVPVSVSWTVQSINRAPVANAGNDITVAAPGVVSLNGSTSSDPDSDPITYRWIAPAGLVLSDSTSAKPSFIVTPANQGNTYSFLLIVSDGSLFNTDVVDVTIPLISQGVAVSVKAFLQGPYTAVNHLMFDSLRTKSLLPLKNPYPSIGFTPINDITSSAIDAGLLTKTGNVSVVDWVWLELRNSLNASQVIATRSALIRRDGNVVDMDGMSTVYFGNIPPGFYFISLRHRNHLGVMTKAAVALNSTQPATIDFSLPTTDTYGIDALFNQDGVMVLRAGDANGNRQVSYNGSGNDKNAVLGKVGLNTANNQLRMYDRADVNMDGVVKYNGAANDKNVVLSTVGLTSPNRIIIEQIPN